MNLFVVIFFIQFSSLTNTFSVSKGRVAYGVQPNEFRYPYNSQVALEPTHLDGLHVICTGTIIHPMVILTAAHCLELEPEHGPVVRVEIFYGGLVEEDMDVHLLSSDFHIHPDHREGHVIDIGVVIPPRPLTNEFNAIARPEDRWSIDEFAFSHDRPLLLCGYGSDQNGRRPGYKLECIEYLHGDRECVEDNLDYSTYEQCLYPSLLELDNGTNFKRNACFGDSGAGVFFKVHDDDLDDSYLLTAVLQGSDPDTSAECGHQTGNDIGTAIADKRMGTIGINTWIREKIVFAPDVPNQLP